MGHIDIYKRRLITGIGSSGCVGREVPHLPSAKWRPRKTDDITQSESKAREPGGHWYNQESIGLRTRSSGVPAEEERDFALPLPFCSTWALSGLNDAHLR